MSGDVAGVIRVAATGRRNTRTLYEILQVLGNDEVMKRFDEAIESLRDKDIWKKYSAEILLKKQ